MHEQDDELFEELRAVAREMKRESAAEVPGYELVEELHRGGQGVVHRAIQLSTRREVALKVLSFTGRRERARFEREVDLAGRLRHPNLVPIFDCGAAKGVPYIAMELVDGVPLDEWVEREQPDVHRTLELFLAIADAVTYAHRHGVIHRDLKPANVLVDDGGRPRVLDFGIARALGDRARTTVADGFTGTLAYASPEQVKGDPAAIDTGTDVYSLGVVLYELLTGRPPHDLSGTTSEILARIAHADPAPSGLEEDLATILDTALAKDPARRYSSVEAFARDVRHWLAKEPIEAREPSAWYELRKGLARHRGVVLTAVTAAVVLALAGGVYLRERLAADRQRENAALIRGVFEDILAAASPDRMGGDVRLLEMFEQVSRDIETTLADAPDAQAAVQRTIGDTYRRLLMPSEALPHLERAVRRHREVDPDGLELASSLDLYGLALAELNRPEAVPVQEEALALRRRLLGEDHPDVAASRRNLAIALWKQWEDVDREHITMLLEQALDGFRAAHGDDHPDVAETKLWLARTGRDDPAPLFAEALATLERRAPRDPRTIDALNTYASFLQERGDFDGAEALLDRSVRLTRELYGEERTAEMLRRQAILSSARGDHATSIDLSRQALVAELTRWSRKSPEASEHLGELAARLRAGEDAWADAFEALRELRGDGAFELASWMNGISRVLASLDRREPIEGMMHQALRIRCRAYGDDCPIRQESIEILATDFLARGRGTEAVPLLEESIATSARRGAPDGPRATRAKELLAACRGGREGS